MNDLIGDWTESEWGTSAGTVIGPYAHDTPVCIQLKFADDMVTYAAGEDMSEVQSELQWSIAGRSGLARTCLTAV